MKAVSLFSGAGCMDLGFEQAGIKHTLQCEIDPKARAVLQHHWPKIPIVNNIEQLSAEECKSAQIIHGGFPCQDISMAGERKGLVGEKSKLWWGFHRIIQEVSPEWIVIENVVGLLSSNKGADLGAILWSLGDLGYGWAYRVLDARYFGVPQRRRRVYIVGHLGDKRAGKVLFEPESVWRDFKESKDKEAYIAALAANGVGAGGGADDNSAQARHLIPTAYDPTQITNPHNRSNPKPEMAHTLPAHGKAPVVAFHPSQDPITSTEESHALSTGSSSGQASVGVMTNFGVRRLMPLECERLMGLPDDWTKYDGDKIIADSHRYRLCGNGVAVPVAKWIAKRIVDYV